MAGLAFQSNAQEKGQFWLGGTISYNSSDQDDFIKTESLRIGPRLGYGVSDNWAIGLSLQYGLDNRRNNSEDTTYEYDRNSFSVSPYVRYTFLKKNILHFFAEGELGYAHGKTKYKNDYSPNQKWNNYSLGIRPGILLNLSNHIKATTTINILSVEYQKSDDQKNWSVNADSGSFSFGNLVFGVAYYF